MDINKRKQFEAEFVKTDYFDSEYRAKGISKPFSWNDRANRYVWHDIQAGWEMWKKAQAVLEWVSYELEKPKDGQKCLVVFESMDGDDSHRWMCVDEFNEGMFDFIANWEDECASVALPAGSVISKVRAVCWAVTNLSNAPLSFDQFYKAQEPTND